MSVLAVYDCMLWFMRAARPFRFHDAFSLIDRGEVRLCVSLEVLSEIRDVMSRPHHQIKFPALSPRRIDAFLESVLERSIMVAPVPHVYELERDPKDSKYVNLAIAAGASYLVTRDHDLLELGNPTTTIGMDFQRRFPNLQVVEPSTLVRKFSEAG